MDKNDDKHKKILYWGLNYRGHNTNFDCDSVQSITKAHYDYLKKYFALAGLGHSKTADSVLVKHAQSCLYSVRVLLEKSILKSITHFLLRGIEKSFCKGFYGVSKKQGISVRMPLMSCMPTKLCSRHCYAHDALDAAPNSVVRGVINGAIAEVYENGDEATRKLVASNLNPKTKIAIESSLNEVVKLPKYWNRKPRIRFSHVGDIVAFPKFTNFLSDYIRYISNEGVVCALYTRRKEVKCINMEHVVTNFTIDYSSLNRLEWIPDNTRMVFAAFGGKTYNKAAINFLEHHRWHHYFPNGDGVICPATDPRIPEETCDDCQCSQCFQSL